MKKIVTFASLALLAGSSFAATAVTAAHGTTGITNAECTYISTTAAAVKLNKSAGVAAAFSCNSTSAASGAAHTQGKKKAFVNTSAGGAATEVNLTANPANDSTISGFETNVDNGLSS